jgi:hypothetical protein
MVDLLSLAAISRFGTVSEPFSLPPRCIINFSDIHISRAILAKSILDSQDRAISSLSRTPFPVIRHLLRNQTLPNAFETSCEQVTYPDQDMTSTFFLMRLNFAETPITPELMRQIK